MAAPTDTSTELLTPGEVARMFHVAPKTVTRWAESGKLPVTYTLGGHRRFPADAVRAARNLPDNTDRSDALL
ncbi:BldC family transcriptional regulator [Solicola sp. PLA-1-18]|uniref:BldC family transcriptional regulator n=1 Tax=Solicola sp. PLA-1-18 TaxID=3380532 RepID=UPI003B7C8DDB